MFFALFLKIALSTTGLMFLFRFGVAIRHRWTIICGLLSKTYKTLILTVLFYGAEARTLLSADAVALRVVERKVLRKIFGPVRVGGDFHIRFNSELRELIDDIDVVQRINIQRLRWLGHDVR